MINFFWPYVFISTDRLSNSLSKTNRDQHWFFHKEPNFWTLLSINLVAWNNTVISVTIQL